MCSLCVARCEAAKFFRDMAMDTDEKMRQTAVIRKPIPNEQEQVAEADSESMSFIHDDEVEHGEEVDDEEYSEEQTGAEDEQSNVYETVSEEVVVVEELMVSYDEPEEATPRKLPKVGFPGRLPIHPVEYKCQFCDLVFRYRTALMNHYQDSHTDEAYTCEMCDKSFTAVQTWRAHNCLMNEGHFCCDVCGKIFKHRTILRTHQKSHSVERYSCEFCQKQFVLMSQYKTHLKRHSNEKKFQCEHCLKGFKEKREMIRHLHLVHTKKRPFQCDQCPRAFAFRYMLNRHLQVHTGIRPYSCSLCFQNLSSHNALKHHMFTHTGAKPYACDRCPAAFRVKVNLNKHLKEHEVDYLHK